MNTEKNMNVLEMIDAFEVYEARGVFDDEARNDKFLRFILDHSKVPSYRSYKKIVVGQNTVGAKGASRDIVKKKPLTLDELTAEQLTELKEVQTLMGSTITQPRFRRFKSDGTEWQSADEKLHADYAHYDRNSDNLRKLITKFPHVLQEQVLIIAIMIYVLRYLDADFNSDTNAFAEFYHNYSEIVCSY